MVLLPTSIGAAHFIKVLRVGGTLAVTTIKHLMAQPALRDEDAGFMNARSYQVLPTATHNSPAEVLDGNTIQQLTKQRYARCHAKVVGDLPREIRDYDC